MSWNFENLEGLIERRGTNVIVETGVACTCRNTDPYMDGVEPDSFIGGKRKIGCTICYGESVFYRNARKVRGLLTSVETGKNRQLMEAGYAVSGDAVFSTSLKACPISDLDKITFCVASPVSEGQVITRDSAHIDENIELFTDLDETEDRLWYNASKSIWCESESGIVFKQNSDFLFEGRKIKWISSNAPKKGERYTIKYTAFLEWIAYSSPFHRYDNFDELGQRVILRKKHVDNLAISPNNTVEFRKNQQIEFNT